MSERIPPPADDPEYARDMAILDADPRTGGNANRPPWLVRRVLAEHKKGTR